MDAVVACREKGAWEKGTSSAISQGLLGVSGHFETAALMQPHLQLLLICFCPIVLMFDHDYREKGAYDI